MFFRSKLSPVTVKYYLGVILEYIFLSVKKPLMDSMLFSETNVFCFLCSVS